MSSEKEVKKLVTCTLYILKFIITAEYTMFMKRVHQMILLSIIEVEPCYNYT